MTTNGERMGDVLFDLARKGVRVGGEPYSGLAPIRSDVAGRCGIEVVCEVESTGDGELCAVFNAHVSLEGYGKRPFTAEVCRYGVANTVWGEADAANVILAEVAKTLASVALAFNAATVLVRGRMCPDDSVAVAQRKRIGALIVSGGRRVDG